MTRRKFLKDTSATLLIAGLPLSCTLPRKSANVQGLLITQYRHEKSGNSGIAFIDLKKNTLKMLAVPYLIHGVLAIRNGNEFLLTAKGGYLFHVTQDKVLSSLKSPKDIMFYGHSSFDDKTNIIYTSAIEYMDYDHWPYRMAVKKNPNDTYFARGRIYKIDINNLEIKDWFSSGGYLPHDQRIIDNELMVLNSYTESSRQGRVSYIDLKTEKINSSYTCQDPKQKCPIAHMYGDDDNMVIVGISDEASVLFFENNKLTKTTLNNSAQSDYNRSELLNGALDSKFERACVMNIDNKFLGLWDKKTAKMIKHKKEEGVVSVNTYGQHFVVYTINALKFYNRDLVLDKSLELIDLNKNFEGHILYGPHSIIL